MQAQHSIVPSPSLYIQQIPFNLKPREKLLIEGSHKLTDQEILMILIGSGVKGHSVCHIAEKIRKTLDVSGKNVSLQDLQSISGLGDAKSTLLLAAIELGRRMYSPRKHKVSTPKDIIPLLMHYADRDKEYFLVITLNGAHEVISKHVISIGLIDKTIVHPREVFFPAISDKASAIIIAHNHPSGNIDPSSEDIRVTLRLKKISDILGITMLDHIIFSTLHYYSFTEHYTHIMNSAPS